MKVKGNLPPKPEKRTVAILTYPGYRRGAAPVTVEVEAEVYDDLIALHKALHYKNVAGWDRYAVTHLPTSYCLGWFSQQRFAKQYALDCLALLKDSAETTPEGLVRIVEDAYRSRKFLDTLPNGRADGR